MTFFFLRTIFLIKIVSRYNILYFILTYCIPLLVMLLCYVQMGKVYLLLFRKTKEGESALQIALCINPEIYLCLWCLYYLLIWQYFTRCCGETSHLARKMSPRGKARKQNKRQLQDYVSQKSLYFILFPRQIVKMFGAVTLIFAFCWLPYHVYFIISYFYPAIMKVIF